MNLLLKILGVLFLLTGAVWILQGLNILLGSFMSGQSLYVVLGLAVAAVGVAMLVIARRRSG